MELLKKQLPQETTALPYFHVLAAGKANTDTPNPPQIIPQPHTIESTMTELTCDNPDHDTTRTHGLKHHSVTTTELLFEPPQQEIATLTTLQARIQNTFQSTPIEKPDNWNSMSATTKKNWLRRRK